MSEQWVSLAKAAQRLGMSWGRAWRLVLDGTLAGEQRNGKWYVTTASLERVARGGGTRPNVAKAVAALTGA